MHKLQRCIVNIGVRQKNGMPAPFATVDAFAVYRFLFWEYDSWETGAIADFYGVIRISLRLGQKYHLRFKWQDKRGDIWITPTSCPYTIYVYFTY